MNPWSSLPDDAKITLTKRALDVLLGQATQQGRHTMLGDVKDQLGFSRNISFDDVPPIVSRWKEIAEEFLKSTGGTL